MKKIANIVSYKSKRRWSDRHGFYRQYYCDECGKPTQFGVEICNSCYLKTYINNPKEETKCQYCGSIGKEDVCSICNYHKVKDYLIVI